MNKSVAYHDNDKNHRCPPYQDCCNRSCESSWRAGLGALALASRQCVLCDRLLVPLMVSAAGVGVWKKSTKEVAVPGSLVTPMSSRCWWGCPQAQFLCGQKDCVFPGLDPDAKLPFQFTGELGEESCLSASAWTELLLKAECHLPWRRKGGLVFMVSKSVCPKSCGGTMIWHQQSQTYHITVTPSIKALGLCGILVRAKLSRREDCEALMPL